MSTDWNIYCRTCNDEHSFNDANHRDDLMLVLIEKRKVFEQLAPLFRELDGLNWCISEIGVRTSYGAVDAEWFEKHAGHELVPRNEYGECLDDCGEYFTCEGCSVRYRCALPKGHKETDHQKERNRPWIAK